MVSAIRPSGRRIWLRFIAQLEQRKARQGRNRWGAHQTKPCEASRSDELWAGGQQHSQWERPVADGCRCDRCGGFSASR